MEGRPPLHTSRGRSPLTALALVIVIPGLLVSLTACGAFGRSSPEPATKPAKTSAATTEDTLGAPDTPDVSAGGGTGTGTDAEGGRDPRDDEGGSFLRRLPALLDGLVGASDHPGVEDGYIADGDSVSPFEEDHPAIANLDHTLLAAVQAAAWDASEGGVEIRVSSGWRSAAYQQYLLDEAIRRTGSEAEARRMVSTPGLSSHVTGDAVDIAPVDAMSWLSQHGAGYGLCQTYANELWHYELMTAPGGTCPPQLPDASGG